MTKEKINSLEEFRQKIKFAGGLGFISPLGIFSIDCVEGKWLIHDSGCAPKDVVGSFDTIDSLVHNFKRDGVSLYDVLQDIEVFIDDEA